MLPAKLLRPQSKPEKTYRVGLEAFLLIPATQFIAHPMARKLQEISGHYRIIMGFSLNTYSLECSHERLIMAHLPLTAP